MELKEFIKNVIKDITDAIKESQDELENGAVVSPYFADSMNGKKLKMPDNSYMMVNDIDFDVAVEIIETENHSSEAGIGVHVVKLFKANAGAENETENSSMNISKVRFSVPVAYPCVKTKAKRNGTTYTYTTY